MSVALATSSLIVIQRQTADWKNLSDDEFYLQSKKFCHIWGKPEEYVWMLFQLWNTTFHIDYREVRQQLKDLSIESIETSKSVTFVPFQDYQNILQREAYYLFLDDDDWIDPDIYFHLDKQLDGLDEIPELILWRSANIGSPQQENIVFVWGMNGRCMTNNYAVHGSWLKPFSKIYQVLQHKDAVGVFQKLNNFPHLDCVLTVSNKSPISSVSLDRGLCGELVPSRLTGLVENYLERMRRVDDSELVFMPWSRKYLNRTIQIFERVLDSRR